MPFSSVLFVLALVGVGCTSNGPDPVGEEAISREAFVEAYRELRIAALRNPTGEIDLRDRDRILADLGVTEEDLEQFVEVWGRNGPFMEGVWHEVDSLMSEGWTDPPPGGEEEEDVGIGR